MIAVDPDKLFAVHEGLLRNSNMLAAHGADLQEIQQSISSITGMEEISQLVIKASNQIDEQIALFQKLLQAAENICKIYESGEQRIIDYCENAIIHYRQPEEVFIDLTESTAILNEFSPKEVL